MKRLTLIYIILALLFSLNIDALAKVHIPKAKHKIHLKHKKVVKPKIHRTTGAKQDNAPNASVELLSQYTEIEGNKPFYVGIHFKMKKGWHIYWRNPGDAGMATKVVWDLPKGYTASNIQWPYPEKVNTSSTITEYIYNNDVMLLATITPPFNLTGGEVIPIKLHVDWLACKEVCIPGKADLETTLIGRHGGAILNKKYNKLFADAIQKVPVVYPNNWDIRAEHQDSLVAMTIFIPQSWGSIGRMEFLPFEQGVFNNNATQYLMKLDNGGYLLQVKYEKAPVAMPNDLKGNLLVVRDGTRKSEKFDYIVDIPINFKNSAKNTK